MLNLLVLKLLIYSTAKVLKFLFGVQLVVSSFYHFDCSNWSPVDQFLELVVLLSMCYFCYLQNIFSSELMNVYVSHLVKLDCEFYRLSHLGWFPLLKSLRVTLSNKLNPKHFFFFFTSLIRRSFSTLNIVVVNLDFLHGYKLFA